MSPLPVALRETVLSALPVPAAKTCVSLRNDLIVLPITQIVVSLLTQYVNMKTCYVSHMTRFGIDQLVEAVRSGIRENGVRPYSRQLGVPVGVVRSVAEGRDPSSSTVSRIAQALGFVFYIGPPSEFSEGQKLSPEWQFSDTETLQHVGFAKCGIDGWADATHVATPLPAPEGLNDPDAFYVTAKGQSMLPEGIRDGWLCLVSPATEYHEGDRVWLMDRLGKQSLKRLVRQTDKSLILRGWQPLLDRKQESFEDERFLSSLEVVHSVVAVFRRTEEGFEFVPDPAIEPTPIEKPSDELARIRLHDVQASAGPGQLASDGRILSEIGFPVRWLARHGISPSKAALIHVEGDSMSPTIASGAMVLIDHNRTTLRRRRIYAFRDGDELYVKRLEKAGDHIIVLSDNPDHETRLLSGVDLDGFALLGEVVWSGRDWS